MAGVRKRAYMAVYKRVSAFTNSLLISSAASAVPDAECDGGRGLRSPTLQLKKQHCPRLLKRQMSD